MRLTHNLMSKGCFLWLALIGGGCVNYSAHITALTESQSKTVGFPVRGQMYSLSRSVQINSTYEPNRRPYSQDYNYAYSDQRTREQKIPSGTKIRVDGIWRKRLTRNCCVIPLYYSTLIEVQFTAVDSGKQYTFDVEQDHYMDLPLAVMDCWAKDPEDGSSQSTR